jgi:hypothetical protein
VGAVISIAAAPIGEPCSCGKCVGPDYEAFAVALRAEYRSRIVGVNDETARRLRVYERLEVQIGEAWHRELERRVDAEEHRRRSVMNVCPPRAYAIAVDPGCEITPAIVSLRHWVTSGSSSDDIAVLSGPPGTGKTVAACRIAIESFSNPRFVTAAAFARMSRYGEERKELTEHGPLILDDLGAEYLDAKGSVLADLDDLIDTVYRDQQLAVITTNCTPAAFKKRYGARITDRLAECAKWIPVVGKSRRRAR